jgi:hypothetical protein
VPIKFSLGGNYGLGVIAATYPKSSPIGCSGSTASTTITETVNAGSSSLAYDAASGQYTYVWKTDKAWAKTCRQFVMRFTDGKEATAKFEFK